MDRLAGAFAGIAFLNIAGASAGAEELAFLSESFAFCAPFFGGSAAAFAAAAAASAAAALSATALSAAAASAFAFDFPTAGPLGSCVGLHGMSSRTTCEKSRF